MASRSHQQNTFDLPLTDHSSTNIACQGRYNNQRKFNNLNHQHMPHHHLHKSLHPWSLSQHTCRGWSSRYTRTCIIWLTSKQQIIGSSYSWMTTSTTTHSTSIAKTLILTLGLLPSSLEPLLHCLEIGPFFMRRRVLQMLKKLPKEIEKDEDMANHVDYFMGGNGSSQPWSSKVCDFSLFSFIAFITLFTVLGFLFRNLHLFILTNLRVVWYYVSIVIDYNSFWDLNINFFLEHNMLCKESSTSFCNLFLD